MGWGFDFLIGGTIPNEQGDVWFKFGPNKGG